MRTGILERSFGVLLLPDCPLEMGRGVWGVRREEGKELCPSIMALELPLMHQ
jgi:hypothetical protein